MLPNDWLGNAQRDECVRLTDVPLWLAARLQLSPPVVQTLSGNSMPLRVGVYRYRLTLNRREVCHPECQSVSHVRSISKRCGKIAFSRRLRSGSANLHSDLSGNSGLNEAGSRPIWQQGVFDGEEEITSRKEATAQAYS
jgi:hypothetical protein